MHYLRRKWKRGTVETLKEVERLHQNIRLLGVTLEGEDELYETIASVARIGCKNSIANNEKLRAACNRYIVQYDEQ